MGLAGPAYGQVGLSLAAVSDYRYRGVSLSDARPAASLSLSYDHPSGLYAGTQLIAAQPRGQGAEVVANLTYAGYVARRGRGPAVDLGAIRYDLTSYGSRKRTVDYGELYVGLVGDHLNAHLYYAPDYYQSGVRTLYADLAGGFRPTPAVRLFGHVGVHAPVGGRKRPQARKVRYDFRAGTALDIGAAELSLSWTRLAPAYAPGGDADDKVAVGLAVFF